MSFRVIFKISFFLVIFTLVWVVGFDLEKTLAYYNDSPEPATRTIDFLNRSDEEEAKKIEEIERIREEIERIRQEVERIRIGVELEQIRAEIVLLEKKISLEKITGFSKEITTQLREGEILEKIFPQGKETEEKLTKEEIVEEKPSSLSTSILVAIANIFSNLGKISAFYSPSLKILVLFVPILVIFLLWYFFGKKRREKPSTFSPPTFFLLLGILITICFAFLPRIYDPMIMRSLSVGSSSLYGKENLILNSVIQVTWFIFVSFFLFPIAVMLPLHWYERGKIRRTERKIPGSPKVSLILPAYNEEKFIQKATEQGLKQDYRGELEIIIIDDGSTDRTFEIAQKYAEMYSNVKVYRHDKNRGKPAALNTGFQKATSEISIFSDTDSHLDFDLVSKMVPHFDDPQIGAVAGMIIIDNEINLLTKLQQIEYLYNQEIVRFCQETHKGVLICPGAATAVRTQIARDIPSTERTITEDADFTFEVAKAGWKVGQEPEAISRTDAPENWKELINQRKRWLYGVLQTIYIHKWALFFKDTKIPNLWVWWAWIGYVTCPVTVLAVLTMPLFIKLIGINYLVFLGLYSTLVGAIFVFAHWYGIRQYTHSKKTKLALLLPIYMIYQYILNVLLFYLVIAFATRKGIKVRYGGRDIHAV